MAPKPKLTDQQVKTIRRRGTKGEQLTALAHEYRVNRKTLRRRLDALAQTEAERAQRIAAQRLRKQAAAERQKLQATLAIVPRAHDEAARQADRARPLQPPPGRDPLRDWRERPKNSPAAPSLRPTDVYVLATPTAPFSNGSSSPS